jgi:hypothetical protein
MSQENCATSGIGVALPIYHDVLYIEQGIPMLNHWFYFDQDDADALLSNDEFIFLGNQILVACPVF